MTPFLSRFLRVAHPAPRVLVVRAVLLGTGSFLVTLSAALFLTGRDQDLDPASAAIHDVRTPSVAIEEDRAWRWQAWAAPSATPSPTPSPTSTPSPAPTPTPTAIPRLPSPTQTPPPAPPLAPVEAPPASPAAAAPATEPSSPPPAVPIVAMTALEQAMFDDINALRVQHGLPALAPDAALLGLARERSADMATRNYFSHTTPEGLTVFDLMAQRGIEYGWAGENLARNNYPEEETERVAFESLVASPPHFQNMLGAHYTRMGVGVAVDGNDMFYFTMLFTG
jgi:uncharacterized protein YkwD